MTNTINRTLSDNDVKRAIKWIANNLFCLSTIAQEFGLTREQLKAEIRLHNLEKTGSPIHCK